MIVIETNCDELHLGSVWNHTPEGYKTQWMKKEVPFYMDDG